MSTHLTRRTLMTGSSLTVAIAAIPAAVGIGHDGPINLFAVRLAEWDYANTRFREAANAPHARDEVVNPLCRAAAEAYRSLLATPAPHMTALLQKLKALSDWSEGSEIPEDEVRAISEEGFQLLACRGEA